MRKPAKRIPGDSPIDAPGVDSAIRRYRKSRTATLDDLYETLTCTCMLSPEEAEEMCMLEGGNE